MDADGDGWTPEEDCDDGDPTVHPDAPDAFGDEVDQDCDGVDGVDADGDGVASEESGGSDCDDGDPSVSPLEAEVCGNHRDEDCQPRSPACGLPAELYLADAAARYDGEDADQVGSALADVGDVDGDGHRDFAIGAQNHTSQGEKIGAAYLVLGQATPAGGALVERAVRYLGEANVGYLGKSVDGAGDVDGDGLSDWLVGATGSDAPGPDAGEALLILGTSVPEEGRPDTAAARLQGESEGDHAGWSVAGLGDLNGDGLDDVGVGAVRESSNEEWSGAAYVVLGGSFAGTRSLAEADAVYHGVAYRDYAGRRMSGGGDLDGDGLDDAAIAADGAEDQGIVGVVLGRAVPVSELLETVDAVWTGEAAEDRAGIAMAGVTDLTGDGYADLAIGAPNSDEAHPDAGTVYLVEGAAGLVGGPLREVPLRLHGASTEDGAGASLDAGSDVDGDGTPDLCIGAPRAALTGPDAGAAYLVWGGAGITTGDLDAAAVRLLGEDWGDFAGGAVAGIGDFDADGFGDLAIGAAGFQGGSAYGGTIYLVLGSGD